MKILVTGATGFTGGHLARRLVGAENDVRVLARSAAKLPNDLKLVTDAVEGDLRDREVVREAVRGCSAVYHIAALYRSEGRAQDFFDVNVEGTRNILDACEAEKVERIVHCSTVGVHGHLRETPGDENAPFSPGDPYQRSKLEGELLAQRYISERGLPISIFRPTGIYGPGDTRLLKFFRLVKKRRPLIGNGTPHYHLTHIDDLVRGIVLCGTRQAALGEVFILGGPAAPTLREWYDLMADILGVKPVKWRLPVWPFLAAGALAEAVFKPFGKEPPIHRRSVHFFTHDRAFVIDKARHVLGFEPQIGLRQGMTQTAEWYRKEGLL